MFDDAVLQCFLEKQRQLFPEDVAETLEAADGFLEECMAVVVDSVQEVAKINEDAIAKPPTTGVNAADYYIKGIARWKGEVQLIIDCDKFFDLEEQGYNAAN